MAKRTGRSTKPLDALLIAPPVTALRRAGLVREEVIQDARKPFEHPQGLLSMASYAASPSGGKPHFRVRVLPLDAHILRAPSLDSHARWDLPAGDVEKLACSIAEATVRKFRPRVVGISVLYYLCEPFALSLAAHLKARIRPAPMIVLGGQEVSFYDTPDRGNPLLEAHPYVDAIVRKEGELTFQEILERTAKRQDLESIEGVSWQDGGRIHISPDRGRLPLERVPSLEYDRLILPAGMSAEAFLKATNVSVVAMRGCKHGRCAFCISQQWFGGVNSVPLVSSRALTVILRRWERALRRVLDAGVDEIQVLDETLNAEPTYFAGVCGMLSRLQKHRPFRITAQTRADCVDADSLTQMKSAGVGTLYIGVESGSPAVLRRMDKWLGTPLLVHEDLVTEVGRYCGVELRRWFAPTVQQVICAIYLMKKSDMKVGTFWMVGHPGSNPERERESLQFLEFLASKGLLGPRDPVECTVFIPENGTPARDFAEVEILETDKRKWGRLSGYPVHQLRALRPDGAVGPVVFTRGEIRQAFVEFRSALARLGLSMTT